MRAILVLALLLPTGLAAQIPAASAFPAVTPPPPGLSTGPTREAPPDAVQEDRAVRFSPGAAFAASLVVPGAGQAGLGLRRWAVYVAAEIGLWALRLDGLSDERRATAGYRDLAWEAARIAAGPREDGGWGYYETMATYARSGEFDRDAALAGVQPETDESTYNGTVWALARALYLPGGRGGPETPEYQLALEYYAERAAGPGFLWSWVGHEDDLRRYRGLIDTADDAARRARTALGLVLANHLVSAADAFLAARHLSESGVRLESRLTPAPRLRWSVGLRIPIQD